MSSSSSSSHATVTCTSMSIDNDGPSFDDLELAEAPPLLASVSPTILSPDYSTDSKPMEEDPEEDPEEEHSEKEAEEPYLWPPPHQPYQSLFLHLRRQSHLRRIRSLLHHHPFLPTIPSLYPRLDFVRHGCRFDLRPLPSSIDALVDTWVAAPAPSLPPPSLLSPLSSLLPRIPSPSLLPPPPTHKDIIPEVGMPPRKRARFGAPSHRTVGHGAAYGMPWKTLMKMMTENYFLRSEIKKPETELWNMTMEGTNVESYT
nr:hypothetical protein [Tanacetum cinerariifolium]GEY20692.1 hypothetical protein [Tanacetum cinerariifolium]